MRYTMALSPTAQAHWDAFWCGLSNLGELSNREAEIVADVGRRDIAAHFEGERSPEGVPWVPLALRTQEQRKLGIDSRGIPFRTGASHPILVRTGDLKQSLTDPRHPRNITELRQAHASTFITLSAEDDPATPGRIATLHAGGYIMERAWGLVGSGYTGPTKSIWVAGAPVPPRPFMGLSERGMQQLREQASRVLRQRLERL